MQRCASQCACDHHHRHLLRYLHLPSQWMAACPVAARGHSLRQQSAVQRSVQQDTTQLNCTAARDTHPLHTRQLCAVQCVQLCVCSAQSCMGLSTLAPLRGSSAARLVTEECSPVCALHMACHARAPIVLPNGSPHDASGRFKFGQQVCNCRLALAPNPTLLASN